MRRCVSFLILLIVVAVVWGQQWGGKSSRLLGQVHVESGVWDFSSMVRDGRGDLMYVVAGDSVSCRQVMELLPEMRFDFVGNDREGYRLTCVEGRNWRAVIDSLMIDGRTHRSDTILLSVDLSHPYLLTGNISQRVEPGQTIVVEPGDTVNNVKLLSLAFSGKCRSLLADSLSREMTVERRYWFATQCAYPRVISTRVDGIEVSTYMLDVNPDEDDADRFIADALFDRALTPKNNVRQAVAPSLVGRGSISMPSSDIVVEVVGRDVKVGLLGGKGKTEVILCDVLGRVIPATEITDSEVRFRRLSSGDYILSVMTDDGAMSQKIYISQN